MTSDPTVVAPENYKVVLENEQVRVLKVHYGPYHKAPMHHHPDSIIVCLTEMNGTFTYPDGRSEEVVVPAGVAAFIPATTHQAENRTPNRVELFMIELKPPSAPP